LRLADSIPLSPGDRFVIRQLSPVVTIGGGEILDAATLPRRIAKTESLQFLKSVHGGTPEAVLLARIIRRGSTGLTVVDAVLETGWTPFRIEETAKPLVDLGQILRTPSGFVFAEAFRAACGQAIAVVTSFQDSNRLVAGISREELREQLGLSADILNAVIEHLAQAGQIEASGEQVHLPGRTVRMKDDEAESKALIETAFASAGLRVPALKEVLSGLTVDRARAQKIVTLLLRDKTLIKVSDELVFHREALEDLRKRLGEEKSKSPRMDVSRFKDLTGITRKYAIPLLEYLDREHVTRRIGNERQIL
jgi:selenocysteine-specific elongation factor